MGLDHFLSRTYHADKYTCLHFADDVWRELRGESLIDRLHGIDGTQANIGIMQSSAMRNFRKLSRPESPCIVFFRNPGFYNHVGIFVDGSILHLTETGAAYQRINVIAPQFKRIGYYQ